MQQKFEVLNVKCGGCANTLKSSLQKEFGDVDVDLEVTPRIITLDIDNANVPALRIQLKKLGYPMSDEDLSKFEDISTTAKSYVSCAIGKINK